MCSVGVKYCIGYYLSVFIAFFIPSLSSMSYPNSGLEEEERRIFCIKNPKFEVFENVVIEFDIVEVICTKIPLCDGSV